MLIPGGPGASHSYMWPHLSSLNKDFQVIYYDPYGRGASDYADDPSEYTFMRDVDEIEGLRIALKLPKINLYGHSYGGLVAQAYALKHPESVDKVVLANRPALDHGLTDHPFRHRVGGDARQPTPRRCSTRTRSGFRSGRPFERARPLRRASGRLACGRSTARGCGPCCATGKARGRCPAARASRSRSATRRAPAHLAPHRATVGVPPPRGPPVERATLPSPDTRR